MDKEIVWSKKDSEVTILYFWKKLFLCERCGRETHLTIQGYPYSNWCEHHAICKTCYEELHAFTLRFQGLINYWR